MSQNIYHHHRSIVITESIPVADSAYFVELALRKGVRIVGPNCQ